MSKDLATRSGRYRARLAGLDVPKQKPGPRARELGSLIATAGANDCWLWLGTTDRCGYGRHGGQMAHRAAWVEAGKELPPGAVLMHSCDNPACCNLAHLSIGTHRDNQADKTRKGRQARGEVIGAAILTEAQVAEIRRRYVPRRVTYQHLADEFGVCKDTIQKAVRGINWGHV